ncbi:hypothetical protein KI387_026963, partial [Taxus chinensis]
WDIRAKSTRKTRIGRFGASQSISGGLERFVPGSPGQLGQKYAEDVNRPIRPKQETFVWDIWAKSTRRTRKAERAESQWNLATCLHRKEGQGSLNRGLRDICPRQFGIAKLK